jgi:hypothetical protein
MGIARRVSTLDDRCQGRLIRCDSDQCEQQAEGRGASAEQRSRQQKNAEAKRKRNAQIETTETKLI